MQAVAGVMTMGAVSFRMSSRLRFFIKAGVTLIALILVFRTVDFAVIFRRMATIDGVLLLAAGVVQVLSTALAAYRWSLIMRLLKLKEKYRFYVKSYFKGSFFNQIMPSNIGGDAVRVLDLRATGMTLKDAAIGIFVDRLLGLIAILFLALFSGILLKERLPESLSVLVHLMGAGAVIVLLAVSLLHKWPALQRYRPTREIAGISRDFYRVFRNTRGFLYQFFISIVVHVCAILSVYLISVGLGLEIDVMIFFTLMPLVTLFMAVPVSLAGWGIRESAMVGLFFLVGMEKEAILTVSLLYGVLVAVTTLPGMVVWIVEKNRII